MKKSALALVLSAACSLSANAAVEGTWSVGAAGGWTHYFEQNFNTTYNVTDDSFDKLNISDSNGYGFKLNGEYNFTDYLGLGLAWDHMRGGKIELSSTTDSIIKKGSSKFKVNAAELYARIAMPLDNNGSDVFFKVGPAVSWFNVYGDTDRKLGAVAGVGGQWAVNDALAIRAGYDFFFKTTKFESSSDKINTGLLYVGLQYSFGAPKAEAPVVQAPVTKKTVRVTENHSLAAGLLFPFDGSNLSVEGKKAINDVVESSKALQNTEFEVYGYTDRLGSDAYNNKLSQRRADSVTNELQNKGVTVKVSEGRGKSSPVTGNKCDGVKGRNNVINCLAADRRVEIVITGDTTKEEQL